MLVGPHRYTVRIADRPLVDGGESLRGLCDEAGGLILISPDVPPARRAAVLYHELTHAFVFAFGEPADVEGWCELTASVAQAAVRGLGLAGGEVALAALQPGEVLSGPQSRPVLNQHRYCPQCGGTIAAGSVGVEPVIHAGQPAFRVRAGCEFCDRAYRWVEAATASGQPSGTVLDRPRAA